MKRRDRQWLILSDGAPLARGDVLVCERQRLPKQASFGFFLARPYCHRSAND
jgi:hypothetical protein